MAGKVGGIISFRYRLAKFADAFDEFLFTAFQSGRHQRMGAGPLASGRAGIWPPQPPSNDAPPDKGDSTTTARSGSVGGGASKLQTVLQRAREVYGAPLTQHMYLTGPAMAPTLNRHGAKDPAARERLVVRLLRRPGPRNVFVGDVVAFHSPLAQPDDATHVMVRRVAALEGQEMVSRSPEEPPFLIPPGHCWVLADNTALRLEDGEVIDSRSYGHIPFSAVIGRVVYGIASRREHGRVANSPEYAEPGGEDEAVVAAEVDVEDVLREEEEEEEVEVEEEVEEEKKGSGKGGRKAGRK